MGFFNFNKEKPKPEPKFYHGWLREENMLLLEVTGKFCPFATAHTGAGTFWIYHNCIGENCQIWNDEYRDCGLKQRSSSAKDDKDYKRVQQ